MKVTVAVAALSALVFCLDAKPSSAQVDDVAIAEELIWQAKEQRKAIGRAKARAIKAIAATKDGKVRMKACGGRPECLTAIWPFKGVYKKLAEDFYKAEMIDRVFDAVLGEDRKQ